MKYTLDDLKKFTDEFSSAYSLDYTEKRVIAEFMEFMQQQYAAPRIVMRTFRSNWGGAPQYRLFYVVNGKAIQELEVDGLKTQHAVHMRGRMLSKIHDVEFIVE